MSAESQLTVQEELAAKRTQLAIERTFLSYVRTALALIVAGAALIKFLKADEMRWTGAAMIAAGIAVIFIGVIRYKRSRSQIQHSFRKNRAAAIGERESEP